MIVSRPGGEPGLDRHSTDRRADCIDFAATRKTETAFASRQSAKQTDESGSEQSEANRPADRSLPLQDQISPQIREHDEVGPNHNLQVVPAPRRRFDKESENENRGRSEHERDLFRLFASPLKPLLPNSIAENSDERQHQWYEDSKVKEPKTKERHFEFALALDPAPLEFDHGLRVEVISDQPNEKRRRNQRAENKPQRVAANLHVARNEQTNEQNAECHEGMDVKQRHRCINGKLGPKRQWPVRLIVVRAAVKLFAPMPQYNQAGGNGVKQTTLGHDHR